jgi:transposase
MKRFKSVELLLHSEARARRYLREKCWQNKTLFCIRCRSRKIYRLADKRYRCGQCGYTFQEFAGRWIAELQIGAAKWLWALKLFELDLTADRIADEIGISHPTALKAVRLIRSAILQRYLSAGTMTGQGFWRQVLNQSAQKKPEPAATRDDPPVFRIQQRNGALEIIPAQSISAATLRNLKSDLTKLGHVLYLGPFDKGQVLIFWGGGRFGSSQTALALARAAPEPGSVEEFLLFARRRLRRARRLSQDQFPLYLMEIKFRYDYRNKDLFDSLVGTIAQLVPDR